MNEITCRCTYTDGDNMFCPVHGTLERSKTSIAPPTTTNDYHMTPQEQIKQEAERRYVVASESSDQTIQVARRMAFKNGANLGYSLAQPEIDRLKELLEEAYLSGWRRYAIGGDKKDGFKQFKQQHNL